MKTAWVIGGGGLLGTALRQSLHRQGAALFIPQTRLVWPDPSVLFAQLEAAVQSFAAQAAQNAGWKIYWAAGVGSMGSVASTLALETKALSTVLLAIEHSPTLLGRPGKIVFSSSAGAIYAGSRDRIITESSAAAPTTPYAMEKLKQEGLIAAFSLSNPLCGALVARLSTVYGPGQAAGKQQGLLTHIARRIVRNQLIQIYVPFDTIRDYIAVADAANAVVCATSTLQARAAPLVKIFASEQPTTIAEIISIFRRTSRRSPRIVTSASRQSALYSRRMLFRSEIETPQPDIPATRLPVGIARLLALERSAFAGVNTGLARIGV